MRVEMKPHVAKLLTEELLSLTDAAKEVPRPEGQKPPHVATVWRWAIKGVRGNKLEIVKIGSRKFTSREAITRFVAAANEKS